LAGEGVLAFFVELTVVIHEVLHPTILKLGAVLEPVRVEAGVAEGALTLSKVEDLAGNLTEL